MEEPSEATAETVMNQNGMHSASTKHCLERAVSNIESLSLPITSRCLQYAWYIWSENQKQGCERQVKAWVVEWRALIEEYKEAKTQNATTKKDEILEKLTGSVNAARESGFDALLAKQSILNRLASAVTHKQITRPTDSRTWTKDYAENIIQDFECEDVSPDDSACDAKCEDRQKQSTDTKAQRLSEQLSCLQKCDEGHSDVREKSFSRFKDYVIDIKEKQMLSGILLDIFEQAVHVNKVFAEYSVDIESLKLQEGTPLPNPVRNDIFLQTEEEEQGSSSVEKQTEPLTFLESRKNVRSLFTTKKTFIVDQNHIFRDFIAMVEKYNGDGTCTVKEHGHDEIVVDESDLVTLHAKPLTYAHVRVKTDVRRRVFYDIHTMRAWMSVDGLDIGILTTFKNIAKTGNLGEYLFKNKSTHQLELHTMAIRTESNTTITPLLGTCSHIVIAQLSTNHNSERITGFITSIEFSNNNGSNKFLSFTLQNYRTLNKYYIQQYEKDDCVRWSHLKSIVDHETARWKTNFTTAHELAKEKAKKQKEEYHSMEQNRKKSMKAKQNSKKSLKEKEQKIKDLVGGILKAKRLLKSKAPSEFELLPFAMLKHWISKRRRNRLRSC